MTIRRWTLGFGLLGLLLVPMSRADAQEVQLTGPLAGQPAVRHLRMYREGRIELQPFAGFSLQDEFARTMAFGAQAHYYVTDWLGFGATGAYGLLSIDTSLTDEIGARGITTERNALSLPSREYFTEQVGRIQWYASLQGQFIPLRGKVSFFQKLFVDTDLRIFLGVAFVGVEERANVDASACPTAPARDAAGQVDTGNGCIQTQFARTSRVAIAPVYGVGMTFYINGFLGLALEWRGMPFAWNTSGTDQFGPDSDFPDGVVDENDREFKFNQFFQIGLSIMLPQQVKVTD